MQNFRHFVIITDEITEEKVTKKRQTSVIVICKCIKCRKQE